MGVAMGLASALARTPTPVPEIPASESAQATPAEILTGELLPPEFTWGQVFTQWQFDVIWALIVVFGSMFYVWGHVRLARRGDAWPVSRTIMWVSGMLLLGLSTNSGLAVYGTYLFSVHMVAHMLLSMAAPLLLVLSAPITLASRAIAVRKDGSRGAREWILLVVHSRYLAILGHPWWRRSFWISLIVFYYSPLFRWALEEHLGHQWMILHFVFTGYLFAQSLVGVDPTTQPSLPPAAHHCVGHYGVPRLLWSGADLWHWPACSRVVWGDGSGMGSRSARRPATRWRARVGIRGNPDPAVGPCGDLVVE